jgi:starvation-inducible DNA-binding protein
MNRTKNDLPEKVRIQVVALLEDRLADAVDLTLQIKQAHWNVKGPSFIALHELFDRAWNASQKYADLMAERIVQLGGTAKGTLDMVKKKSTLPEYPVTIIGGKEHVAALSHSLSIFGKQIRAAIGQAAEMQDAGTADLLTEVSRGVDETLWFVEAHGQSDN